MQDTVNEPTEDELDSILNGAKTAQDSIPICMRADVLAEIAELEREIHRLRANTDSDDPRMVDAGETTQAELAERIRDLEEIAHKGTINLRLQAVDRRRWESCVDNHKTFDEETQTEKTDLNAIVDELLPESIVSPVHLKGARYEKFLANLSEAQWEKVMQTIWDLNRTVTTVGKSVTASQVFQKQSAKQGPVAL